MVNEEKLVHFFLLDAKKVCCFLLQLAKLHILRYRKLTGYRSIVRLLRAVDDDLLGGGNVGSNQDGGIDLNIRDQSSKFFSSYIYCLLILLQQLSLGLGKCVSAVPRHFCWSVMLFWLLQELKESQSSSICLFVLTCLKLSIFIFWAKIKALRCVSAL